MSNLAHLGLPMLVQRRLADLPRQAQFLLLTLRLAHELSIEDRQFQGFVYTLCGISRVERALVAVGDVLQCLGQAPRAFTILSAAVDELADDEQRLLALLGRRRDFGSASTGPMIPQPPNEALVHSLNRLADALE